MMKNEFEALAGYEVSLKDYNEIIEPMYMATEMSKADFVKCIDKKRFALKTRKQIENEMKKIAEHLAETCEHYTDYDAKEQLRYLAKEYCKRFYGVDWTIIGEGFYFRSAYTIPELMRGCTYPEALVIYNENCELADVQLVK